jgi:hypothetical protein
MKLIQSDINDNASNTKHPMSLELDAGPYGVILKFKLVISWTSKKRFKLFIIKIFTLCIL